jgi:hypothetical protein
MTYNEALKAAGRGVNALVSLWDPARGLTWYRDFDLGNSGGLKRNRHLTIRRTLLGEANQIATHATPYETIATVKAKE